MAHRVRGHRTEAAKPIAHYARPGIPVPGKAVQTRSNSEFPVNAIRRQFLLTFALMGATLPYLSKLLAERDLTEAQIGLILGADGLAVLVCPLLLTAVADRFGRERLLLAASLLGAAGFALALFFAKGFWAHWLAMLGYGFCSVSIVPLLDGLFFRATTDAPDAPTTANADHTTEVIPPRRGGPTEPGVEPPVLAAAEVANPIDAVASPSAKPAAYHHVRAWGTAGFVLPALGLWWWMELGRSAPTEVLMDGSSIAGDLPGDLAGRFAAAMGGGLGVILLISCSVAMIGALNALWLPGAARPRREGNPTAPTPTASKPSTARQRVPTLAAIGACLQRPQGPYLAGQWLLAAGVFAFYFYQPLYLSKVIGIPDAYLGLVVGLGVLLELFWMVAFGRILRALGTRRVILIGGLIVSLRFGLLAAVPTLFVALATQLMHGPMVLAMHVAPPVLLNKAASKEARASVQGVYQTIVLGTARIAAAFAAGAVAGANDGHHYSAVMGLACAACTAGLLVHWLTIRRWPLDSEA